jgi:hypothetical protein
MMELHGEGITGEEEVFQKPIFQTFGMFVGMMFGLVMHWTVLYFKLPFPGYPWFEKSEDEKSELNTAGVSTYGSVESVENEKNSLLKKGADEQVVVVPLPTWMYFFLAIPSIFDLAATVLCMMGLQYIDVSIYQLLRGSGGSRMDKRSYLVASQSLLTRCLL